MELQEKLDTREIDTLYSFLDEDYSDSNFAKPAPLDKTSSESKPPRLVKSVPRLKSDIKALATLFESDHSPIIKIRCNTIFIALFSSGDASGTGFGSVVQIPQKGLSYRIGVWDQDIVVGESFNWGDLTNCVEAFEEEAEQGNLHSSEVYFFTDNSTVERCFYKGSSSSPKLLDLVIRLRHLE